jgi:hypothetical protein
MPCPRCKSPRIQRDYDDAIIVLRVVGFHKLLCNNCGLVFKSFDPLGKKRRAPSRQGRHVRNRRRVARYYAHLPAAISLIDGNAKAGKVSYSQPSRGHCDAISKFGMGLSFVGTRFPESELSKIGRLLFVTVDLPEGPVEAVVSIVTHDRVGEEGKRKWALGVAIHQIGEQDHERLTAYLEKRATERPVVVTE